MEVLIFGVISISLSVFANSMLVYLKKNNKWLFRKSTKNAILFHGLIIVPLWSITFTGIIYLSLKTGISESKVLLALSSLTYIASLVLFIISLRALGWGSILNQNIFEKEKSVMSKSFIFKYFDNPMYVSFDLFFVALALFTENAYTLAVSVVLFVGLNLIQARIEKP